MAYVRDANADEPLDEHDFDESAVNCPKCGAPGEVTEYPRDPKGWWGRYGRAQCVHCGVTFTITIEEEAE